MGALSSNRDFNKMQPRLVWLCAFVVCFLVVANYSGYQVHADSIDDQVDKDIVFDSLEKSNRILRSTHRKVNSLSNSNIESSQPSLEEGWILHTVNRIKRGISGLLSKNSSQGTKQTQRKRRQYNDDDDDQNLDNDEEDEEDGEYPQSSSNTERQNSFEEKGNNFNDDEDLEVNSGDSGDGEIPESTTSSPYLPPAKDHPVYFRITMVIREPFVEDFNDRNSFKHKEFAEHLIKHVEELYKNTPGTQSATVISIQKYESDPFSSKVTLDLGSDKYYDQEKIKNILLEHIRQLRRIGYYEALPDEFMFKVFDAPTRTCESHELVCNSGECISATLRCNGVNDCSDGSDENGCSENQTPRVEESFAPPNEVPVAPPYEVPSWPTQEPSSSTTVSEVEGSGDDEGSRGGTKHCRGDDSVPCSDGSGNICADQQCDGTKDCNDGSDEENCPADCNPGEFSCDINRCIPNSEKCDGRSDCVDGIDERDCRECNGNSFLCDGSKCVLTSARCDGKYDCNDQTDEQSCQPEGCARGLFDCGNGQCIDSDLRCNNAYDCQNGVDELNCTQSRPARCRTDQFTCGDGLCIPQSQRCDRKYNCRDGSDEKNCPCRLDDFHCGNGYCIPAKQRCDGTHNCQDASDEIGCSNTSPCQDYQWRCHDGTCIDAYLKCNFVKDCPDNSDETTCQTCNIDDFRCNNGTCISISKRCDGVPDCSFSEDEESCERCNQENEFKCQSGQCIPITGRCNTVYDCADRSDEQDCNDIQCNQNTWKCKHNRKCINQTQRCNGYVDCPDGSDESNCGSPDDYHRECPPLEVRCENGSCVKGKKCNGQFDCPDGSDEIDCPSCAYNQFVCSNGECISDFKHCDSNTDCADGSDEEDCGGCSADKIECDNGRCVSEDLTCDGVDDCGDGSDERDCQDSKPQCSSSEFACESDKRCLPLYLQCDGRKDCVDGSDEKCACRSDQFPCLNGQCIESSLKCNRRNDCSDGSDEFNCPTERPSPPEEDPYRPVRCYSDQHLCRSDNKCIDRNQVCDGNYDCSDYSDERDCNCPSYQFQCPGPFRQCIDQSLLCNGRNDCSDGSDERNCPTEPPFPETSYRPPVTSPTPPGRCPAGEYPCRFVDMCISASKFCDGNVDCPDDSDELNCTGNNNDLNIRIYPESQSIKENPYKHDREVVFRCRDEGLLRARVHWVRPNGQPLPPGTRDLNGRLEIPDVKVHHGGMYICEALGFPEHTPRARVNASLLVEPWVLPPTRPPTLCAFNEATCANGDCISKDRVCDGTNDCTDGSDESRCKICEPNEFRCSNKKCVSVAWVCDGENDCGDNSDEESCPASSPGDLCTSTQFTCHSKNMCISKSFQCDNQRDCSDSSDEIGCTQPVVSQPPPPMMNLEIGSTFEITCRAVGVPVPVITWRLNWRHVPKKCRTTSVNGFGTLTCPNIQIEDQGAYSCEATSKGRELATPDTILTVSGQAGVCQSGYFNEAARTPSECLKCFCFGHSAECRSANLYVYHYQAPFDNLKIVGVRVDSRNEMDLTSDSVLRSSTDVRPVGGNGVQAFSFSELARDVKPYFAMPESYLGSDLKSYGGYLRYSIRHNNRGYENIGPDVILAGNGYILEHTSNIKPQAGREEQMSVRFFAGEWYKKTTYGRDELATREDIMMTLANVENMLIKLQYNDGTLNTTVSNIVLDSADAPYTNFGVASLVEECTCPVGYTGYSCEKCADGYLRHDSGPWLGQCYESVEERCQPGTYGDPSRGLPCEPCPCPLTNPSNQFARTCSLGSDGNVRCDCQVGYVGNRCEQCAPGYDGNPMIPGSICRPVGQISRCNSSGSEMERTTVDGECQCKNNVVGPYCDQCKANTFYLSSKNQFGCISCFCMGVSSQCTSSSWYRDSITSAFTSSRNDFKLVDTEDRENPIEEGIKVDANSREIQYSNFPTSNVYYWSLPSRYLGDQITAYGGKLRYTLKYVPLPGGQSSRNAAADVELISDNHLELLYYAREQPKHINAPQTFEVPLLEQYWQRSDGQKIDREHLLMALADLRAIYIKATYTTNTREVALISVSLDSASETNTGNLERALEVEQCFCPEGYRGLSCEDCAVGFTRGDDGLYLNICEPCNCNGHSSNCHPETGECYHCRDFTTGDNCEVCLPGYEGDPTQGIPCRYRDGPQPCNCDIRGADTQECYNNVCRCKSNVEGDNCDRCRVGTFGLSASNVDGCETCFCSGVSRECSESTQYIEQIPTQILDEENHGFFLTDEYRSNEIKHGFQFNYSHNEISYTFRDGENRLYWSLPVHLTKNQLKSYGGKLEFTIKYVDYQRGRFIPDRDVILIGNNMVLYWTNPSTLVPNYPNRVAVTINAGSGWHRDDRNYGPRPASREDILMALTNIERILVRAKVTDSTTTTAISDVTLDTAIDAETIKGHASSVEVCRCPVGYQGTSCESCIPGFYRDPKETSLGPLGSCTRCPCTENADGCELRADYQVECKCKQNFTGLRCETRLDAVYTPSPRPPPPVTINITIIDPKIGIYALGSIMRLNCSAVSYKTQGPVRVNWNKDGSRLPDRAIDDGNGILIISDLRISDSGRYICQADDGYSVIMQDITVTVGTSRQEAPYVIASPPYTDVYEGQPIEVKCSGNGNPAPLFRLNRLDGQRLNPYHSFDNGLLRINSASFSDSGQYECLAENGYGSTSSKFEIFVKHSDEQVVVNVEPPSANLNAGETITLSCTTREPARQIKWSKQNGKLPYNSREQNGILTMYQIQPEDTGTYVCTVQAYSGTTGTSTSLVVVAQSNDGLAPKVTVTPDKQTINQGSSVELRCEATGSPPPNVKWTKVNSALSPNVQQIGSTLHIRNAQFNDRGIYVCVADNIYGLEQAHSYIEVDRMEVPIVQIYPNSSQTVISGVTVDLQCIATAGIPSPIITWSRPNGLPLSSNVQHVASGVIRLTEITRNEDGQYVCTGKNQAGTVSAIANILVQTPPEIHTIPNNEIITKMEGDYLKMECLAEGFPTPTTYWTKYDNNIHTTDEFEVRGVMQQTAVFEFRALQPDDEGLYVCNARSDAGTSQKRVQVVVDTAPKRGDNPGMDSTQSERVRNPNQYEPDARKYIAAAGDRAELRCSMRTNDKDIGQARIHWYRADNQSLSPYAYTKKDTLYIDQVQETDAGQYVCKASLESTNQVLFKFRALLDVISPPRISLSPERQIVHPGDSAQIRCIVHGQQPIQITWSSSSRSMPPSVTTTGDSIYFNNIQLSDAGRYRCSARNQAGEAEAAAEVVVQETKYRTVISSVNKSLEAPLGSHMIIQCSIQGNQRSRVSWSMDGRPLPPNHIITPEENLELPNVQWDNEGRYICAIETDEGTSSDYTDVRVTRPNIVEVPSFVLYITPAEEPRAAGDSIVLTCQSNEPGVIATWSKPKGWIEDNVQHSGGGTLKINRLRADNAGVYRCEATGQNGVYHKDYNLEVTEQMQENRAPPEKKVAPRGSNVILECDTPLKGSVTYEWSKQGGELPTYSNIYSKSLQLNNIGSTDAGTYVCIASNNIERDLEVPIVLVVSGIVPYFAQAPSSFLVLPTLADAYIAFNFEISIKPEKDGLILYNGNKQGESGADFISLSLVDSAPEFKMNLGHKVTTIRGSRISMGKWHTIKVTRNRKKATMYVDHEGPFVGTAEGKYQGLDLSESLYLGGVPYFDRISPEAESDTGFVGCISQFKIGHSHLDVLKEAIEKRGITTCETCLGNNCQNQGVCQEELSAEGYMCICPAGFSGQNCNKLKGEACSPHSCGSGRCIDNEQGFKCLCPLGRGGKRCENEIVVNTPSFQGDAYVAYPTPHKSQRRIKFSVKIMPNEIRDGLILYSGETDEGDGDFISLAIKDGHIEFRYDVGNGPTVIRSNKPIVPGKWVAVTATKSSSEGRLIVDDDMPVISKLGGNHRAINLYTATYVGGVDNHRINVNEGAGVSNGFNGCIEEIIVNGMEMSLLESVQDSANVEDCSANTRTGCTNNPCLNGGQCYPLSPVEFRCNCLPGYRGENCELMQDLCEDLRPCQNGGTCRGNATQYVCDCQLGHTGKNCDQRLELRNDVHFSGDGFLELDRSLLNHVLDEEEVIALELSTNSSNGLIFWHGQQPYKSGQGHDYISLAIVDGYLEFQFDLGSGPAIIYNGQVKVNDGERHSVILKREGRTGSIEVDHAYLETGEADGYTNDLNCDGNVYLGGTPNISLMTGDKYHQGFNGCIHGFELQNSKTLDLGAKALSGKNVKACSGYEGNRRNSLDYGRYPPNDA